MKNLSPTCLGEIFISTLLVHLHNLRGSANNRLIPRPLSQAGKRSFYYRGATLWNGLPSNTKKFSLLCLLSKLHCWHCLCPQAKFVQLLMVIVFIYRIFYLHIQMRFTLLQCKGEIEHQHMSISDLIQPTQSTKS